LSTLWPFSARRLGETFVEFERFCVGLDVTPHLVRRNDASDQLTLIGGADAPPQNLMSAFWSFVQMTINAVLDDSWLESLVMPSSWRDLGVAMSRVETRSIAYPSSRGVDTDTVSRICATGMVPQAHR
jgi:hypothetical protein